MKLLVSCEHAAYKLPARYASLLQIPDKVLHSHLGYDAGAFTVARQLAAKLNCRIFTGKYTRLLIDLNRSLYHNKCFSRYSRILNEAEKRHVMNDVYLPYRAGIENEIKSMKNNHEMVLHLSIHSFTPVLNGVERQCDVGLLYDPSRTAEQAMAKTLKLSLKNKLSELQIRSNYPYKGIADGLTTYLRKQFDSQFYMGLEVEINQRHVSHIRTITSALINAVQESLENESNIANS